MHHILIIIYSLTTHEPRMISILDYVSQLYFSTYRPKSGEARIRLIYEDSQNLFLSDGLPDLNAIRKLIPTFVVPSNWCTAKIDLPQ